MKVEMPIRRYEVDPGDQRENGIDHPRRVCEAPALVYPMRDLADRPDGDRCKAERRDAGEDVRRTLSGPNQGNDENVKSRRSPERM